ncbi:MAG: hypothetical protein LC679_15405 [Intrasporangiaceae bacterium]|nr:hypothetical protein [Intrasporangiaceae bacterium]
MLLILGRVRVTKDNPFPAVHGRVCYHPCETVCNRAELDGAVSIHAVERFLGLVTPATRRNKHTRCNPAPVTAMRRARTSEGRQVAGCRTCWGAQRPHGATAGAAAFPHLMPRSGCAQDCAVRRRLNRVRTRRAARRWL